MPEKSETRNDISVRVQIFPSSVKRNIKTKPLKAFRMRMRDDLTFGDLANTALARYAKECPQRGCDTKVDSILDDTFFAVEMEETLDLLKDGEVLKLVLEPVPQDVVLEISSSESSDNESSKRVATPSQQPAVKGLRFGRGPVMPMPSRPARRSNRSATMPRLSQTPKPRTDISKRSNNAPKSRQSRAPGLSMENKETISCTATFSKPKSESARKPDPYEIPSDTDQMFAGESKGQARLQKSRAWEPRDSVSKLGQPKSMPPDAKVISIVDSAKSLVDSDEQDSEVKHVQQQVPVMQPPISSTSAGAEVILIEDSTASQDDSGGQDGMAKAVGSWGRRDRSVLVSSSQGSCKSRGKRSAPHAINNHLEVIEGPANQSQTRNPHNPEPAYTVNNSQGMVPIFRRKEAPGSSEDSSQRQQATGASSTKSTKCLQSTGSLTIKPSQIGERVKDLQAQMDREKLEREAESRRVAEEKALQERRREEGKATIKALSRTVAARTEKGLPSGLGRTPRKHIIPVSFFSEPQPSDEELDEALEATPQSFTVNKVHKSPSSCSFRPSSSHSRSIPPSTRWKPMNTLSNFPISEPRSTPPRKFGPGYSQRVREAFSDSEDGGTAISESEIEEHSASTSLDVPGTPELFRGWMKSYQTMFATHFGFCSVADGPWKGLIRSGPDKGKYLPGFQAPTSVQIMAMEKTAVRREKQWNDYEDPNFKSSGEVSSNIDPGEPSTPPALPLPFKTPTSTKSETTSVLIMNQLLQNIPPSNQELGALISSVSSENNSEISEIVSPERGDAEVTQYYSRTIPGQCLGTNGCSNSHNQLKQAVETPRRASQRKLEDADLDVTPNFERALSQVETPSAKSRSTTGSQTRQYEQDSAQPAGLYDIVVKIPDMPPKKQAEYRRVPEDTVETDTVDPIRSFEAINSGIQDSGIDSQDSGIAAVEHVLKTSPSWLSNVTEVTPDRRCEQSLVRKSYDLRSTPARLPDRIYDTTPSRKRKVAESSQDGCPTYRPSERETNSDNLQHSSHFGSQSEAAKGTPTAPWESPSKTSMESPSKLASRVVYNGNTTFPKTMRKFSESRLISTTPIPVPIIPTFAQQVKTSGENMSITNSAGSNQSQPSTTAKTPKPTLPAMALPPTMPTSIMPPSPAITLAGQSALKSKHMPPESMAGASSTQQVAKKRKRKGHDKHRNEDRRGKHKRKDHKQPKGGNRKCSATCAGPDGKQEHGDMSPSGLIEISLMSGGPPRKRQKLSQPDEPNGHTHATSSSTPNAQMSQMPDTEAKEYQPEHQANARTRAKGKKKEQKRKQRLHKRKRERSSAGGEQPALLAAPKLAQMAKKDPRKDGFDQAGQKFPSPPPTSRPSSPGSFM